MSARPPEGGAGRADDGAADDEDVVLQHEPRGRRREAREGVEERDHDGHVGAAYRGGEQEAQGGRGPGRGRREGGEERGPGGHVGAAYRDDEQDAQDGRGHEHGDHGGNRGEEGKERPVRYGVRPEDEDADEEQRVDHLLEWERDRAAEGELLELQERHDAPHKAYRTYKDGKGDRYRGDEAHAALGLQVVELGERYERSRPAAAAVE